jgi:2-hydroxy-3-keto-5-methylthiopentenyl-1-phosphate phosphatase
VTRLRKRCDWIAYVGDGYSDRCVVKARDSGRRLVDEIFAKDALARFCSREGIAYEPFRGFGDLARRVSRLTFEPGKAMIPAQDERKRNRSRRTKGAVR